MTVSSSEAKGLWRRKLRATTLMLLAAFGSLVSLAVGVGSIVYPIRLSAKADRLNVEGVPVVAAVSDFYQSSGRGGGADTMNLTYTYGGRQFRRKILCGGGTGCASHPPRQMMIRVDHRIPTEFVAENGHTDGSVHFLNHWSRIPCGFIGALGLGAVVFGYKLRLDEINGKRPPEKKINCE